MGDLITVRNQCISGSNLFEISFSPRNVFDGFNYSIPAMQRQSLKMEGCVDKELLPIMTQLNLFKKTKTKQRTPVKKAVSKGIYEELKPKLITMPPAQLRYYEIFEEAQLEWKENYTLPFKVALDTKSREFQYKILNRYLVNNVHLKRIGKRNSSAFSFMV